MAYVRLLSRSFKMKQNPWPRYLHRKIRQKPGCRGKRLHAINITCTVLPGLHAQQLILRSALEWADMCRLAEQGGRA